MIRTFVRGQFILRKHLTGGAIRIPKITERGSIHTDIRTVIVFNMLAIVQHVYQLLVRMLLSGGPLVGGLRTIQSQH